MPSSARVRQKEIRSLLCSFLVIRILKYTANEPLATARLAERLGAANPALDARFLDRTLLRLRRQGLLTAKNSSWSLTSEGRKALKLAISGLKDLARLTHDYR
jgi:hypothetical protein